MAKLFIFKNLARLALTLCWSWQQQARRRFSPISNSERCNRPSAPRSGARELHVPRMIVYICPFVVTTLPTSNTVLIHPFVMTTRPTSSTWSASRLSLLSSDSSELIADVVATGTASTMLWSTILIPPTTMTALHYPSRTVPNWRKSLTLPIFSAMSAWKMSAHCWITLLISVALRRASDRDCDPPKLF